MNRSIGCPASAKITPEGKLVLIKPHHTHAPENEADIHYFKQELKAASQFETGPLSEIYNRIAQQ